MNLPSTGRWDPGRDGPLSEAALRRMLQSMGYRVARYEYPPGTFFPEHCHPVEKIDAVLAGTFRITLFGRTVHLGAGEWIRIPAGAVHDAAVIGEQQVIALDAVRLG